MDKKTQIAVSEMQILCNRKIAYILLCILDRHHLIKDVDDAIKRSAEEIDFELNSLHFNIKNFANILIEMSKFEEMLLENEYEE